MLPGRFAQPFGAAMALDIVKFLGQVFLFSDLAMEDLKQLADHASAERLGRETHLFYQGDRATNLYIVVHGKLAVYRSSMGGTEQVLHICTQGDLVAEAAIFNQQSYPAHCKALGESLVIKLEGRALVALIKRHPQNALKIMSSYAEKLREFVHMIEYLSLNNVGQRVIIYLIKNAKLCDGRHVVHLDLQKRRLAALLGTVPETLSRNLRKLRELGLIRDSGEKIEIVDMERLRLML